MQRKDLVYTGRTFSSHASERTEEMDDHYFGTIRQSFVLI